MKIKISDIKTLSAPELELLGRLEFEGREIYTRQEISSFCPDKEKASYLIKKMLEKKRLKTIIRNVYLLIPMKAPQGQWAGNEYLIAKALAREANYYIGYSAVFNSYGFTDQVAQMVHVVNDKYSMNKAVFGIRYKFIKTLSNRFYGLENRKIQNQYVAFPDRERAMIDVFEFYDTEHSCSILRQQIIRLNMPRFIEYVARYPVKITRRRIGYFLECLNIHKKSLNKIDAGKKGYSSLYADRPNKGYVDKSWRIVVNG